MRTKNTLLNFWTSFIPWLILGILGFVKIKIFINVFGSELNGLIQLAFQIFTFLSIVTLGFPAAVKFFLYKPLLKQDTKKINEILSGAKKTFDKIGSIIFIGGILFSFLIPYIVHELNFPKMFVFALFALYSLDYLTQYILLLPYKVIFDADQKTYIVNTILNTKHILFRLLELVLILLKINYLIILLVSVVGNIIATLLIVWKAKQKYSWINMKVKPDNRPLKMTKDVMFHKISNFVFHNTDVFVISVVSGLTSVSIYGAYNYIIQHLITLMMHILKSPQSSIANFLNSKLNKKEKINLISEYWTIVFFMTAIIVPIFAVSAGNFIKLWINRDYILSNLTIIMFGLVLWVHTINYAMFLLIEIAGLFKDTKKTAIISSLANVILSICLFYKLGILGALIATFISGGLMIIIYSIVFYKKVFNDSNKTFLQKNFVNLSYILSIIMIVITFQKYIVVKNLLMWTVIYGVVFLGNLIITLIFNTIFVKDTVYIKDRIKLMLARKNERTIEDNRF